MKNLLFSYNHDRDTLFSFLSRHRTAGSWCLENADLKTWDRRQKENNFSRLVCSEFASAKLALSIVLSPLVLLSAPSGPALLCFVTRWLHKIDISTPPTVQFCIFMLFARLRCLKCIVDVTKQWLVMRSKVGWRTWAETNVNILARKSWFRIYSRFAEASSQQPFQESTAIRFAKYRFSFRKVQISFRFVSFAKYNKPIHFL